MYLTHKEKHGAISMKDYVPMDLCEKCGYPLVKWEVQT